jgi:hypothetical protein
MCKAESFYVLACEAVGGADHLCVPAASFISVSPSACRLLAEAAPKVPFLGSDLCSDLDASRIAGIFLSHRIKGSSFRRSNRTSHKVSLSHSTSVR